MADDLLSPVRPMGVKRLLWARGTRSRRLCQRRRKSATASSVTGGDARDTSWGEVADEVYGLGGTHIGLDGEGDVVGGGLQGEGVVSLGFGEDDLGGEGVVRGPGAGRGDGLVGGG